MIIGLPGLLILAYAGLSIFQAFRYTNNTPQPLPAYTPANDSLAYQEISFPIAASDKITLRGWWLPDPDSSRVIIFVHGRGGNRASYRSAFKPLREHGFNILAFDLRGHGQSDAAYCTWGIKEQWDVLGAVKFAVSKGFKPESIGVIGWSVGAASSLMAMSQNSDIRAVVSDSAYANADPLLAHNLLYPGLVLGLRLFRDIDINQINPEQAITRLGSRHVLLIHGAQDGQVPLANLYRLQQTGGANVVAAWTVPGADHTEALIKQPEDYIKRVSDFFRTELK